MPHSTSRRALLRLAAGCPLCLAAASLPGLAAFADDKGKGHHWGYAGEGAPARWGQLDPGFSACGAGSEQSPVDLDGSVEAAYPPVEVAFRPMPLSLVNNGHTLQVNCQPGSASTIGGKDYQLLQFHFHHPSEHLLRGTALAMECHFVHRAADGNFAVLGVFIRPGAENAALAPIWAAAPAQAGEAAPGTPIDPATLLPTKRSFFRYMGSLTTPPCSEGINWVVFDTPIEASPRQIQAFAALFPPTNARPPQALQRRFLLHAGG